MGIRFRLEQLRLGLKQVKFFFGLDINLQPNANAGNDDMMESWNHTHPS